MKSKKQTPEELSKVLLPSDKAHSYSYASKHSVDEEGDDKDLDDDEELDEDLEEDDDFQDDDDIDDSKINIKETSIDDFDEDDDEDF